MTSNPHVRNTDQQLLAFYWADKDLGRAPSPYVVEELDRRNLAGRRPNTMTAWTTMRKEDHLAAVVACQINGRRWTPAQTEAAAHPGGVGITLGGDITDHPAPPARAKLVAGTVLIVRDNGIEKTSGAARLADWP